MNPPRLRSITIYPIKSLQGVSVPSARLTKEGGLEGDRRFAIMDAKGHPVNGKRNRLVHLLEAQYDADGRTVGLLDRRTGGARSFELTIANEDLLDWLSRFFGEPVHLERCDTGGFPDDTAAPGPTLVSTATIREVASWFPGISEGEMRIRLRANLEIDGEIPPFWEDRLFAGPEETVPFRIGEVTLLGTNPCRRCVVPTRDPHSGEEYPDFKKTFLEQRERTLPDWADRRRFDTFYRLMLNTRLPVNAHPGQLSAGDPVVIPMEEYTGR